MSRPALLAALSLVLACAHRRPGIGYGDALTPQEHVRLGALYESQGLRVQALGQYRAAVRKDPAFSPGWIALGNGAYSQGRFKEAEKHFRTALKASSRDSGAANNLAMVLLARGGSLSEAEALAKGALEEAGALRPYVLDTLANVYLRQRRFDEASAALERAEAEAPADGAGFREQLLSTRASIQGAAQGMPGAKGP